MLFCEEAAAIGFWDVWIIVDVWLMDCSRVKVLTLAYLATQIPTMFCVLFLL